VQRVAMEEGWAAVASEAEPEMATTTAALAPPSHARIVVRVATQEGQAVIAIEAEDEDIGTTALAALEKPPSHAQTVSTADAVRQALPSLETQQERAEISEHQKVVQEQLVLVPSKAALQAFNMAEDGAMGARKNLLLKATSVSCAEGAASGIPTAASNPAPPLSPKASKAEGRRRSILECLPVEFEQPPQLQALEIDLGFGAFAQHTMVQQSSQPPLHRAWGQPSSMPEACSDASAAGLNAGQIHKLVKLQAVVRGNIVRKELFSAGHVYQPF